jgi:predicted porin
MKKILLTALLAVATSFAYAQSSVTIYGILDVGYVGTNYKGVGTSATTKQNTSGFGQNTQQGGRLGFRGNEDLGGGTSAFFTVETGLNPESSTLSTFVNRQTFVGIAQKGIGRAAIGTQYTPIYSAVVISDPGNANNVVGNTIWALSPQAVGNTGTAPFASPTSSAGTSDAFTVRTTNTLTVRSESFAGFTGTGMYTANNQDQTQTSATAGGNTNFNGWGLGLNYAYKKLFLTANYQALKSQVLGTATTPTPAAWVGASGGVNTQDNQSYFAGTYDFGILKAYVQMINRQITSTIDSSAYASRTAQQIGIRGYVTPKIESWVSTGIGKVKTYGNSQPTANFSAYQLGSNYYLSKRTNLYVIYGQNQTSSNSLTPALAANAYAVGVRHTF